MWVSCHLINSVESPLTNRPPLGAGGGGPQDHAVN